LALLATFFSFKKIFFCLFVVLKIDWIVGKEFPDITLKQDWIRHYCQLQSGFFGWDLGKDKYFLTCK